MPSEHTPTPWTIKPAIRPGGIERSMDCAILDEQNEIIAECFEKVGRMSEGRFVERPANANAAHIVRCVNCHEALVEALQLFLTTMNRFGNWDDVCFYYAKTAASE